MLRSDVRLSSREVDVLTLVASGFTNKEIGARLYLSEETIKSHVRHIIAKFGARNRAHCVALAIIGRQVRLSEVSIESRLPQPGEPSEPSDRFGGYFSDHA